MEDRLGVLKSYPVNVTPVNKIAQQRLLARLDKMEGHVGHVLTAVRDMKNAVRHGSTGVSHASLATAVMNSRNWVLTVLAAHAYVQETLGTNSHGSSSPSFQLSLLAERAIQAGLEDAQQERFHLIAAHKGEAGYPPRPGYPGYPPGSK